MKTFFLFIFLLSSSSSLPGVVLPPPISVIEPYKVQSTIDYCGNIIYRDGELDKILTQEGYVDRASDGSFQYHYYLRDHQGNNRVVITQNSGVEQVNHYYPFGALFGDSQDRSGQPYKFGGKELDRMYGLDWFDFHARSVDGPLGRTPTPDPMAEKYYSISPYVYCANNPIRFIDPTGMDKWETNDPEEIQRFMDAMRFRPKNGRSSTMTSFNYGGWNKVTEEKENDETLESLIFDDETDMLYLSNNPHIGTEVNSLHDGYATMVRLGLQGGNIDQVNLGFDLLAGTSTAKLVKSLGSQAIEVLGRKLFFVNTKYTDKVLEQLSRKDYHNFPEVVDKYATKFGRWSLEKGGDGKFHQWLKLKGGYKGKDGTFEYIKNKPTEINHRMFKPN